jgi:UDP-glucose 4-epimerase
MSILITGASGFVGRRLLKQLDQENIDRDDIILLTGAPIEGYRCIDHDHYRYTPEMLAGYTVDTVVHLGAATPKGKGRIGADRFAENVAATLRLLESLPNTPSRFLFGSSTSIYSPMPGEKVTEQTARTTTDPYGVSKLLCEMLLTDWCDKRDVLLSVLRFGPVYGPGEESYNKLIGSFLKQAMKDEDIHIYSDGTEQRSMIYVDDVCRLICRAMAAEEEIPPTNLVNDEAISILHIAELVCEVSGSGSKICIDRKGTLRTETYDNEQMKRCLGGLATGYPEGIQKLYEHFRALPEHALF